MTKTALALLMTGVSWGALVACGEKHDVLGSRVDGGGPGAGTGGQGAAGGATGGSGSGARAATGGDGAGETGDGLAGSGSGSDTGGAGGAAESSGGASGSGATAGAGEDGAMGGSSSGEGGGTSAGAAGTATAGTGGAAPLCPSDCTRGTTAGCSAGQVMWTCGNEHDYQALIDGGCTDLASGLPRYCCPPEFYAECACAEATTLEACEARPDCHSVFIDPGPETCRCSEVGCCARFSHCATGPLANCAGPVTCASPTPYCDEPAYVLAYADGCFEGCVVPEDCAIQ